MGRNRVPIAATSQTDMKLRYQSDPFYALELHHAQSLPDAVAEERAEVPASTETHGSHGMRLVEGEASFSLSLSQISTSSQLTNVRGSNPLIR